MIFMGETLGAIDIGSHTARLLIGRITEAKTIREVRRERKYMRLSESFMDSKDGTIGADVVEKTVEAIRYFGSLCSSFGCIHVEAVGTGVMRKAKNTAEMLEKIYRETGIEINVIPGEKEAQLSALGAMKSLGLQNRPCIIFDLGGSTTEFYCQGSGRTFVSSAPIGAMELTKRFLRSDPPTVAELKELETYVQERLKEHTPPDGLFDDFTFNLIGTGGTVTSLVCVKGGIDPESLSPNVVNGFVLKQSHIKEIFDSIRKNPRNIRVRTEGLDEGRADIIVSGTAIVLELMRYYKAQEIIASFSDLLEGLLIEYFEGASHG